MVPDPPPLREHPSRGAGIESPHAAPLSRAAGAAVAANPDAFPFQFDGMIVRYGRTVWKVDPLGYQPDHSILEVLAAAGAVWNPDSYWSHDSQDRDEDYYVVTLHPRTRHRTAPARARSRPGQRSQPSFEVHNRTAVRRMDFPADGPPCTFIEK